MSLRAAAPLLWFPALVSALFAYALVAPALGPAAALGLPAAWNGALVIAPAVLGVIASVAVLERLLPARAAALPRYPSGFEAQTLSVLRWRRTVRESA